MRTGQLWRWHVCCTRGDRKAMSVRRQPDNQGISHPLNVRSLTTGGALTDLSVPTGARRGIAQCVTSTRHPAAHHNRCQHSQFRTATRADSRLVHASCTRSWTNVILWTVARACCSLPHATPQHVGGDPNSEGWLCTHASDCLHVRRPTVNSPPTEVWGRLSAAWRQPTKPKSSGHTPYRRQAGYF